MAKATARKPKVPPKRATKPAAIPADRKKLTKEVAIKWILYGLALSSLLVAQASADTSGRYVATKTAAFKDPNTGYIYKVTSYNVTSMNTQDTYRSSIMVSRYKLNPLTGLPSGKDENIQTLNFHPTLVDFDLHCHPSHCYMVAVTSRTKKNVELYWWKRTQFDLSARKDSFARPYAVKLFRIQSGFYIAVAQEQLHLVPIKSWADYEEPARFVGCALLKFVKGQEHHLKYHQFIRLPFSPRYVQHFTSVNPHSITRSRKHAHPHYNHYLVFSLTQDWLNRAPGAAQSLSFIWSPLNDYFWPYMMPRGVEITSKPTMLKFPGEELRIMNQTAQTQSPPRIEPVESCFSQLQRLLTDREVHARRLMESSGSLWRAHSHDTFQQPPIGALTNISAQVIVHGNVIVQGSLIESPQVTYIGRRLPSVVNVKEITSIVDNHSPAIVENLLKQAHYKLSYIRDKLSRAVSANMPFDGLLQFNNRIRFFGNIQAENVIFRNGIVNSDVRLNTIPFRQLENELVSLRGVQDIAATVRFEGNVVADFLEIHGIVNKHYYMRDALDITSSRIQVIEALAGQAAPNLVEFRSIQVPEVGLSPNATFNGIVLGDFITKDNRTQVVSGRKSFKYLSMGKLNLANPSVFLNGFNIHRLATKSLHLKDPNGKSHQTITGNHLSFTRPIYVDRLLINNLVNKHINISSLIHDSVKTNDIGRQLISGHKLFLNGLAINHLTTDGSINGVPMSKVFNLNPTPPLPDYRRFLDPAVPRPPIEGRFVFAGPATVGRQLNAGLINGVDITRRAVRRVPHNDAATSLPQLVAGRKIFGRPLRITNTLKLLMPNDIAALNSTAQFHYPNVNGIDTRRINDGIARQMRDPQMIYIENLEIDGNLNLRTSWNNMTNQPRATMGNYSHCPIEVFATREISTGHEPQVIDVPVRLNSLRAKSILLSAGAMGGISFPADFVLRSASPGYVMNVTDVQPVYGHKVFEHLVMAPPLGVASSGQKLPPAAVARQRVEFGRGASINNITYGELQTFIEQERQRNSTGEIQYNSLSVFGNIFAKRINGHSWPEDILLKSVGANRDAMSSPYIHRRIYSPLVFPNTSGLIVENQLVLRGPVQLNGRLNGVNLTDFARHSVTYGDKDLFSIGRPIRNKVFVGGITVTGEIRSQGLIDGVNIDEFKNRVVTIGPSGRKTIIPSPKMFMSDVNFLAPLSMNWLNDLPIDMYLRKIINQLQPDSNLISIRGKKTVSGALRINRNLLVQGLINGINFAELQARAISLSPQNQELKFNKTLTIEGDVFMDNLVIDERNGTIDGVKLVNLLPIEAPRHDELSITRPTMGYQNDSRGLILRLDGHLNDCQISCSLNRLQPVQVYPANNYQLRSYAYQAPIPQQSQPQPMPLAYYQPPESYAPRQVIYNGRNVTNLRSTPPYASFTYSPLAPVSPRPPMLARPQMQARPPVPHMPSMARSMTYPDQRRAMQTLATRRPSAIAYERSLPAPQVHAAPNPSPLVIEQMNSLRRQMATLNVVSLSTFSDVIIGFIDATSRDVGGLHLANSEVGRVGHHLKSRSRSFLQLDQIDFPFRPIIYHLSVGVSTDRFGQNVTSVQASLGGGNYSRPSILPVEAPNAAMFMNVAAPQSLFLFVSEDYTVANNKFFGLQCPRYNGQQPMLDYSQRPFDGSNRIMGGLHVYLFQVLKNSSNLTSAFFDLYQTIDLPAIDSLENFSHRGSAYALAVSRATSRVHLLLLRGYTGFQVVSYFDAPLVEHVKVMFDHQQRPYLIVYQSNGQHRIMESVFI